jgi:hypothetical protein
MLTKTLSALALIIGTASGAPAATKQQGAVLNHEKRDARVMRMSATTQRDRAGFVVGNMLFVGFHELGHALAQQLHLPQLGRAEDAADSFATLALLDEGSEFSVNVLVQAARGFFLMDRRDRKLGDALDFSDAHGLDKQRAFQIICLMVGSNAEQFKELADWVQLSESRRQSCRSDYDDAKFAWHTVLKPHLRAADQPHSTIEIAYEAGPEKLDNFVRSFRSMGLLEALSEYALRRYVLPHSITFAMKSCGDANAWWSEQTLTQALCYELAEEFVDLYQGYTAKTASQKKTQTNKLIARNVEPIHLVHETSTATHDVGSGLPETSVAQDRLEKLALDLDAGAVALFTQTGNRQAAVRASRGTGAACKNQGRLSFPCTGSR